VNTWRELYTEAGLTTLPIRAGAKVCYIKGWADLPASDLWKGIHGDHNLGLRCGDGGLLVFDCDDGPTTEYVLRWLDGLGLSNCPGAVTRRGQHIYVRTEIPPEFHSAKMSPPGFEGDIKGRRAYVVAPASEVSGWKYPAVGDVLHIPAVEWRDITWILPQSKPKTSPTCDSYDSLIRLPLPVEAGQLAEAIRQTGRGGRSEMLAKLWTWMLSYGRTPAEAAALVGPLEGRTLAALEADASRVYSKLTASRANNSCTQLLAGFTLPGRADKVRNDARVLAAAVRLAKQTGPGFLMHSSTLAKVCGAPRQSVARSLSRLCDAGLMRRGRRGKWCGFYLKGGRP